MSNEVVPDRRETFEAAVPELFEQARRLAGRLLGDDQAAEDTAAEAMARAWLRWGRLQEASYRGRLGHEGGRQPVLDSLRRRRAQVPEAASADQAE
jgi:DNA-directed RNA polymerase specialized sigma24 family protein